jgi:elongation factor 1-gamma
LLTYRTVASQNEKTTLLGKTKQDYASILKWMSFSNSEVLPNLGPWFLPLIGRSAYNKKNVEAAQAASLRVIGVLEKYLATQTFLVGERLTLADLFSTSIIARGFQFVSQPRFAGNPRIVISNLYNRSSTRSSANNTRTSPVGTS